MVVSVWGFMLVFCYIFLPVFVVFTCCLGGNWGWAELVRARRIRALHFFKNILNSTEKVAGDRGKFLCTVRDLKFSPLFFLIS